MLNIFNGFIPIQALLLDLAINELRMSAQSNIPIYPLWDRFFKIFVSKTIINKPAILVSIFQFFSCLILNPIQD